MSCGDSNLQNFQSLVENYEAALQDVSAELSSVQAEQEEVKKALDDSNKFTEGLRKVLVETGFCEIQHKYTENDLIENLKQQLKTVIEEKDCAVQLWQNATAAVEQLESELKVYQENTEGLVPKSQLTQLKKSYEDKLNELESTVVLTKNQLRETLNIKSRELLNKDASGNLEAQTSSITIIKNLEEEVIKLQHRLSNSNEEKENLERHLKNKTGELGVLKIKIKDCRDKVEEALLVVEAALREKDAALLREAEAKEEVSKLTQTLNDFIEETDQKIKNIKNDHNAKVEELKKDLQRSRETIAEKDGEIHKLYKKIEILEVELEKMKTDRAYTDESAVSRILVLEKNLENTFQKLLLSEKQNIQLKAEMEAIKADLDQMSNIYERDISTREVEKSVLQKEVHKLKTELNESRSQLSESRANINYLNDQLSRVETKFKEQLMEAKNSLHQTGKEREEMKIYHTQLMEELQEQLMLQTEINHKWRAETKGITDQLENVISELKNTNSKIKQENKCLSEKLKEANAKMLEYRKFLEVISQDVSKITTIASPRFDHS